MAPAPKTLRLAINDPEFGPKLQEEAAVRDIMRREMSSYAYAEIYGVSDSTIRHVWTRRTWSHVRR